MSTNFLYKSDWTRCPPRSYYSREYLMLHVVHPLSLLNTYYVQVNML